MAQARVAGMCVMTLFDWILLFVPITCAMSVALYASRFNKSVVDFLVAGRCAGRYLLATAAGEAGSAAVTAIALFQMTTKTGFAFQYWSPLYSTIPILLALLGWITYRMRETRVLSAGQFFEVRYSRSFRLFMGLVVFISGVLNYGVFPAINGRFFVYFLDLPATTPVLGFTIATWQIIAAAYLTICLVFAIAGGQISILISDCIEGMFSQIGYLIIIITLLVVFGWEHIVQTLTAQPPGKSMVNPFDMKNTQDFNIYFILMSLFHAVWGGGVIGGSSAKSPHEQRMAGILSSWRGMGFALMRTLVAICAVVYMQNPHFTSLSVGAHDQWTSIVDEKVRDQMQVPIAASHMLPWGVKGLFCAIMLMGVIAGDIGALQSKGAGFIQDVVLPIRGFLKLPSMSSEMHILCLRLSAVGVAIFGMLWSSFFTLNQAIQLYWQATSAIYAGGAGAVVVFGLYWKRGTMTAAWVTMFVSMTMASVGIYLQQTNHTFMVGSQDFFKGQYVSFFTVLTCITTYVAVSLLIPGKAFDMDRMLHRGKYALKSEDKHVALPFWKRFSPAKIIGIDEEFTLWDRVVAFGIFGWVWGMFVFIMICLVWNLISPWRTESWVHYWFIFGLCIPLFFAVITTVWFTIGGVREIILFIHALRTEKRDDRDDGSVGPGHPV